MPPLRPWTRAALLALLVGGLGVGVARARTNHARGKPVRASSVLVGSPEGVVNGFVEWGSYALHTRIHQPASLDVDLLAPTPVDLIRVFGRGDGYLTDTGPLIVVETSMDGATFATAGRCPPIFTQVTPCEVRLAGRPARYVRVRHPVALVLSEIEVW